MEGLEYTGLSIGKGAGETGAGGKAVSAAAEAGADCANVHGGVLGAEAEADFSVRTGVIGPHKPRNQIIRLCLHLFQPQQMLEGLGGPGRPVLAELQQGRFATAMGEEVSSVKRSSRARANRRAAKDKG